MAFYYSESTGLIEGAKHGWPTADEAFIAYYKQLRAELFAQKQTAIQDLEIASSELNALDKEYGYLVDKYPEEFI